MTKLLRSVLAQVKDHVTKGNQVYQQTGLQAAIWTSQRLNDTQNTIENYRSSGPERTDRPLIRRGTPLGADSETNTTATSLDDSSPLVTVKHGHRTNHHSSHQFTAPAVTSHHHSASATISYHLRPGPEAICAPKLSTALVCVATTRGSKQKSGGLCDRM